MLQKAIDSRPPNCYRRGKPNLPGAPSLLIVMRKPWPRGAGRERLRPLVCGGIILVSGRVGGDRPWPAGQVEEIGDRVFAPWDDRNPGWRKGGNLTGSTLGSELSHQVAERAVAITELLCDLGQGALVHKNGPQGFVASMQGLGGMGEEVVTGSVVHGATSESVMGFFPGSAYQGEGSGRGVGK